MSLKFLQSDEFTLPQKARMYALCKCAARGTDEQRRQHLIERKEAFKGYPDYPWHEMMLVGERVQGGGWRFWTEEERNTFVDFINTTERTDDGIMYCRSNKLHEKLDPLGYH